MVLNTLWPRDSTVLVVDPPGSTFCCHISVRTRANYEMLILSSWYVATTTVELCVCFPFKQLEFTIKVMKPEL